MAYYAPPSATAADALLQSGYTPPANNAADALLSQVLGDSQYANLTGIASQEFGVSDVSHSVRSVFPVGDDHLVVGANSIRNAAERVYQLNGPSAAQSNALLASGYSPPSGDFLHAVLRGYNDHLRIGNTSVQLGNRGIYSVSAGFDGAFGTADLRNLNRYITAGGIGPGGFGTASVVNTTRVVSAHGVVFTVVGTASIWNWVQYRGLQGFNAAIFGAPYVQGGVKFVTPSGLLSFASGAHTVINTTANRTLVPPGIAPPTVLIAGVNYQLPPPNVSPRFLRPTAIYGTAPGFPRVQFPPQPLGWLSSDFGSPVVEYKTKIVQPAGIASFAEGFPRVADRARKVFHAASAVTAVFGDVQVRVKNFRVLVPGLLSLEMSPWAEARNTRRVLPVVGIPAPGVGAGTTAHNKTPSIAPSGFDSSEFGRPGHMVVGWRIRSVNPSGVPVPFPSFGLPSLWQTPSLSPAGLAAPAVPAPTIWPAIRSVMAAGTNMQALPSPTVWFSYRHVVAQGFGIAGTSYGTARIEHDRRGIAMLGAGYMAFGTAWVSRRVRMLAPSGIPDVLLSKHQVGGTRWLGPEGFEATRWLTRITPESREVFPATITAAYGMPTVQNKVRPVFLTGIRTYPDDWRHWGVAKVWNRRQIIAMFEDQESGLWPLPWPQWTAIENRNKAIGGIGFNAGRFGGPLVANNARLLHPSGVAHPTLPEYQKTGSVTHRVRPLPVDGIEPPPMPRWAVVHNAARPLLPQGAVATLWGQTELVNLRRFRRVEGFYSTEFGYPMVADRIRTLSFESRYGIAPPRIELPRLQLHTRYVEPPGIAEPQMGNAALTVFFRRATPRWTHRELFGDPFVWNKTPELRTRGRASDEYGDTFVRLEWRPVAPEGRDTQLFGLARISDRRQRVDVPGMTHTVVSDKVTVRRFGEDPVATQYIDLRDFVRSPNGDLVESDSGFGIPYPWPAMGTPDLLKGYVFHKDGFGGSVHDMVLWGRPTVHANSIRVEPGIFDFYVGEPFVSLRRRQINTTTLGQLINPSSGITTMGSWGLPRISPHTIYAVVEATQQAKRNHFVGETILYPVNDGARVGHPKVTKWNNAVEPHGIPGSGALGSFGYWGVGSPRLVNMRQYIAPYGTLMQRIGWPVVPGPQSIVIEVPITGYAAGTPTVARPPYIGPQTLRPAASSFQMFGQSKVEFRNRTVRPSGWASQLLGDSWRNATMGVNMPQGLHVGPKNLHHQVGFDAAGYGVHWVSLRVRELQAKGHDSFLSEYDLESFAQRMRVRNANDAWAGRRAVASHGHRSSHVGAPSVRPGTHYIRPDGNADQYRKGAF